MRRLRCAGLIGGAAMCCVASGVRADATSMTRNRAAKRVVALSPWEQAEQGRDALEATPDESRTRADYTRVMDAYRAIYHANPADIHAAAAVNAVAELLAEQGRGMHDVKSLKAAVGQYEFLRKQYPASSLRVQALLAEGQIEQDDLGDAAAAKEKYRLLLKQHPKSEQAEEASAALASLEVQGSRFEVRGKTAAKDAAVQLTHRDNAAMNGASQSAAVQRKLQKANVRVSVASGPTLTSGYDACRLHGPRAELAGCGLPKAALRECGDAAGASGRRRR